MYSDVHISKYNFITVKEQHREVCPVKPDIINFNKHTLFGKIPKGTTEPTVCIHGGEVQRLLGFPTKPDRKT